MNWCGQEQNIFWPIFKCTLYLEYFHCLMLLSPPFLKRKPLLYKPNIPFKPTILVEKEWHINPFHSVLHHVWEV